MILWTYKFFIRYNLQLIINLLFLLKKLPIGWSIKFDADIWKLTIVMYQAECFIFMSIIFISV